MITITPSGFTLSEPLVAGEPVAVSVSGFSLAEGAALSLVASACKANYQLAVAVLAKGEGEDAAWTGTLDTATTAASLFFAGASACESRGIRLELVDAAHRDSLAALCCPLQNSTLIPALNPQAVPPVYLATPGPAGDAATVEVGETTTLPAGSPATVENVGTASAAVLNFGIPRGSDATDDPAAFPFAVGWSSPNASGEIELASGAKMYRTPDFPALGDVVVRKGTAAGHLALASIANTGTETVEIWGVQVEKNKTIGRLFAVRSDGLMLQLLTFVQ